MAREYTIPFQGTQKYTTKMGIFGLKTYHLATLHTARFPTRILSRQKISAFNRECKCFLCRLCFAQGHETISTVFNHFQPFSTVFNHLQEFSTVFNYLQEFSTIFNHFQPFSTVFNHFQPFSTIFNHFQPFSTIFNHFQPFSMSFIASTEAELLLCRQYDMVGRLYLSLLGELIDYFYKNGFSVIPE
jgi:hypothetical protein